MSGSTAPTLTDKKGMGGLVAQGGFDQQKWDMLSRLPAWLRNVAFEGVIVEGLEDFEARFFAPHAPRAHVVDRFQAKFGVLTRAEVVDVFRSFAAFEAAYPRLARVQTLVTPALPSTLGWIERDPARVRRARPFYAPFADVRAASDDQLRRDLVAEYGAELGAFVADSVEVAVRSLPDRPTAEAAFAGALQTAFPDLDVGRKRLANAFAALSDRVDRSRGSMLSSRQLADLLADALGTELLPDRRLRVHVRSDRNAPEEDALEVDASEFSGEHGVFPPPEQWDCRLLRPLGVAAWWASVQGYTRVALSGNYRLSTALTLGRAFRSAAGFEIDTPTRSGTWSTDARGASPCAQPGWNLSEPGCLAGDRLVVSVGVLRDPSADVRAALSLNGEASLLTAVLPRTITDGADAQTVVQRLKDAVVGAVTRLRPAGIDLFYVGPAAFAVTLGHRWNALPPTQLHEFVAAERRYSPTAYLA